MAISTPILIPGIARLKSSSSITVCLPPLRTPHAEQGWKRMLNVDNFRVILRFNIGYDTTIFPDGERQKPNSGSINELFGQNSIHSSYSGSGKDPEIPVDAKSKGILGLLSEETVGRGFPKALSYQDIQMMIVQYLNTGQCIQAYEF
ncbi:hypothetical protein COCC4DRAFT_58242 [Bipolaris maydis ATCC 48331]|uniref:Uncharacterized protein n=2 Tax=Cochliobolus heterostrophus TaxID=5016 RepID=M2UG50_COCH5|nr:uncharacterized protein COCC4DRAFT_58242 [Bipolaris maydis ATCC 48331]EMD92696.1 hypothetical protein COCHEDRAFT_1213725 [Bipolaris maydis C5]KAH7553095.1 hypothetical protein BM1_08068 [Bipolaris maydis]ENI08391.1 hypothetical protein COCC4DRAFT_58242 [Bipolaris maydis ATCC 48331]KAJ5021068.1 hypothetical protein J3E73DRAFT_375768 [Bipolaris maydis]KAJ6210461.1 hypothetical protein PSV09DRAFT_1213725 [Bipolaris maydis]